MSGKVVNGFHFLGRADRRRLGGLICFSTPRLKAELRALMVAAALLVCAVSAALAQSHEGHSVHASPPAPAAVDAPGEAVARLEIPDVLLRTQTGDQVHFYRDLVKDKVVAINFIFTTCTTICPPMGANFARLQQLMGDLTGRDYNLISISVDPLTDSPQRLKSWSEKFGARPGWTLLTGSKADVDRLLKALKVFTADKWDHTPTVLIGNDATSQWTRANGLASPSKIAEILNGIIDAAAKAPVAEEIRPAHKYFTDVKLVNQDGREMRLYSDLIKGRVIVLNAFFTACTGSCPLMAATFAKIQDRLGDRLGKDVYLISISVDPVTDTPEKLKAYAERFSARPGWYLLGGRKEDVEFALHKLGQRVENKEDHLNIFIIGNDRTGLWKKAVGLAKPEEIYPIVDSVLNDKGE